MQRRSFKILFVDDEEIIRSMYSEVLENFSYNVFTASNGVEAERVLDDEGDIDLLFTDIKMPKMNGMELLRRVRVKFPNLVKIILTSNRDLETVSEAISCGVYDFIDKPIRTELFEHITLKAIEHIAHSRRINRLLEYLLEQVSNISLEHYYKLDNIKQAKILDAVQSIVEVKMAKERIKHD